MSVNVPLWLAFIAGIVSFLSPCVFALVPAYVGYLSGRSLASGIEGEGVVSKWDTFSHALAFVIGFSVVFIALGVLASFLGGALFTFRELLTKVGGIVIVLFGLHLAGIITIPFLEYDLRPTSNSERSRGYFSSALMGVFFSAGWSPCVGPVLGAILSLAFNGGSVAQGALLLTAYSFGLAIPFLIASIGVDWVTTIIKKYGKVMHYASVFMGLILIAIGVLIFIGRFEILAGLGTFIDLDLGQFLEFQ